MQGQIGYVPREDTRRFPADCSVAYLEWAARKKGVPDCNIGAQIVAFPWQLAARIQTLPAELTRKADLSSQLPAHIWNAILELTFVEHSGKCALTGMPDIDPAVLVHTLIA